MRILAGGCDSNNKRIDPEVENGECAHISGCGKFSSYKQSIQEEFNIGVNARYLLETFVGENITWEFTDEIGPTSLTFGGDETAIIMPMRL